MFLKRILKQRLRSKRQGTSLRAIRVSDEQKVALWNDARQLYRQVVRQRWVVIDEYGGTIPPLLITMVILWLAIIFASFGYRAPRNTSVTASFFLSAARFLLGTFFAAERTPFGSHGFALPFQIFRLVGRRGTE